MGGYEKVGHHCALGGKKIKDIIHHTEDQVILIRLGLVDGKHDSLPEKWRVLGVPLSISDHSVMIY